MYNETNSVKELIEAYESFKGIVMREASWDDMKELSPLEFQIGVTCMKLADASMKVIADQDKLLREMHEKVNRLAGRFVD